MSTKLWSPVNLKLQDDGNVKGKGSYTQTPRRVAVCTRNERVTGQHTVWCHNGCYIMPCIAEDTIFTLHCDLRYDETEITLDVVTCEQSFIYPSPALLSLRFRSRLYTKTETQAINLNVLCTLVVSRLSHSYSNSHIQQQRQRVTNHGMGDLVHKYDTRT